MLPDHTESLLVSVAAMAAILCGGVRAARLGEANERRYRLVLALTLSHFWAWQVGYFTSAPLWEALPLHVCDLGGFIALAVLYTQWRPARALLYFWAFGLTIMAYITPINEHAFPHPRWWTFWAGHSVIMVAALYDVIVLRFRPTWRDLLIASGVSIVYTLGVTGLNSAFREYDFNYAYTGPKDDQPAFIPHLGPWPGRVAWMMLIVAAWYTLLWLPWAIRSRWMQSKQPQIYSDEIGSRSD